MTMTGEQTSDPWAVMGHDDGRTWEERQADLDAWAEVEAYSLADSCLDDLDSATDV